MRRPGLRAVAVAAGTTVALAMAVPLRADWIVPRDGGAFEIDGSWSEKGQMIVFTLPNGDLSSMRRGAVDLEASAERTRLEESRALEPVEPIAAEPEAQAPVLVIRDEDVRRLTATELESVQRRLNGGTDAEGDEAAGSEDDTASPNRDPLAVTDYQRVDEPGFEGVVLEGTVRNSSRRRVLGVRVEGVLYGNGNSVAGTASAEAEDSILAEGRSTTFRLRFPGVFDYRRAEFQVRGFQAAEEADGEGATADEDGPAVGSK